jgi:hypothetical protein
MVAVGAGGHAGTLSPCVRGGGVRRPHRAFRGDRNRQHTTRRQSGRRRPLPISVQPLLPPTRPMPVRRTSRASSTERLGFYQPVYGACTAIICAYRSSPPARPRQLACERPDEDELRAGGQSRAKVWWDIGGWTRNRSGEAGRARRRVPDRLIRRNWQLDVAPQPSTLQVLGCAYQTKIAVPHRHVRHSNVGSTVIS